MGRPDVPLVAIDGQLSAEGEPRLLLANRYADAVLRAGGLALAIPPTGAPRDLERLLERVDGLLIAGGDDFTTERLGLGATHPATTPVPVAKQDFDVELARMALERGLPVLGICYGMQLLALVEGARLFQHLPEDRPDGRDHRGGVRHAVQVEAGSLLARILEVEALDVVSRHHQALASVGPAWRVSARDDEGLIEAVEHREHPFAVGVQWHPELAQEGGADDRLFRALVNASGLYATRRELQAGGAPA